MKVPKKIKDQIIRLNKLESQSKALKLNIIKFLKSKGVDDYFIEILNESIAEMQNEDGIAEGLINEIEKI